MDLTISSYCEPCSTNALGAWKGWPHRDAVPLLPKVEPAGCATCGGSSVLKSDAIVWHNHHGPFSTGLPDYWLLLIESHTNKWGLPFYSEGECPTCRARTIVSEMNYPNGTRDLRHNCASCGVKRVRAIKEDEYPMPAHTIRSAAARWLRERGAPPGHLVASKRYRPDESWTKSKAWWIQVPLSAIDAGKLIHIVGETEPESRKFRHLQVPAEFFQSNLAQFARIGGDKLNLFLSADEGIEFHDERGLGGVSFARFEVR